MRFSSRGRLGVLVAVAFVAVGGVAVAQAVIGGGGVIKSCYSNAKGTWRPIDTGGACKTGESDLQMYSKSGADAAFLGINATAADSYKLGGLLPSAFLGATATAADSNKLGGLLPSAYMQNGDAAGGGLGGTYPNPTVNQGSGSGLDADKLDGIDSTGFVQGRGGLDFRQVTTLVNDPGPVGFDTPFGTIELSCGFTAKYFFRRFYGSPGGQTVSVFDQVNGRAPSYYTNELGFNGAVHNATGVERGTWEMANSSGNNLEVDIWARFISTQNCEFITHWSYGTGPS